jgi:hypothetical protein
MDRRRFLVLALMTFLLLTGCNYPTDNPMDTTPTAAGAPAGRCGDGVCQKPENASRCPEDCKAPLPGGDDQAAEESPFVYVAIMVHLEGWDDRVDEARFERHAEHVRQYATMFEKYGAKLTLESKELTDGIIQWGDDVLSEMEARGHGIGVHADIGGQRDYDCSRFVEELRRERVQLESLGVQVRHVSGNTSHCDWVQATIRAGYEFTSGNVAYSVMSLPIESRPDEYKDCSDPSKCHQTYPEPLEERLHPWRTSNGRDWLRHDPEGELVILPSSHVLPCMAEEIDGEDIRDCTFDEKDIEYFEDELQKAIALADPQQVNQIYVAWSLGSPLDMNILELWLKNIHPYVERGDVVWATLPEIYDAYRLWEQES